MNAQQLIDELKKMPPLTPVLFADSKEQRYQEITDVKLSENFITERVILR